MRYEVDRADQHQPASRSSRRNTANVSRRKPNAPSRRAPCSKQMAPDLIGAQVGLGEDPPGEVRPHAQVVALPGEGTIAASADEVRVVRELVQDRRVQFGKMPARGLVDLLPGVGAVEGHAVEGEHRRALVAEVLVEPMRHRLMQRLDNPKLILVVLKRVLRFVKHGEKINAVRLDMVDAPVRAAEHLSDLIDIVFRHPPTRYCECPDLF